MRDFDSVCRFWCGLRHLFLVSSPGNSNALQSVRTKLGLVQTWHIKISRIKKVRLLLCCGHWASWFKEQKAKLISQLPLLLKHKYVAWAQPIRCTHIGLGFQGEKSKEADIPRIILWWRWLDFQQQQRWHFWYPVPSITVVTRHVGGLWCGMERW